MQRKTKVINTPCNTCQQGRRTITHDLLSQYCVLTLPLKISTSLIRFSEKI